MNILYFQPNNITLTILGLWIGLAFMSATLAIAFNEMLKVNGIFNFYAKFLLRKAKTSILWQYLSKPLGLCPFCNGTWIGIVVYLYFFGLNLPILLFVGLNYFCIMVIYSIFNPK